MSRVYELSEGRYGYLGSWHTHPRGSAVPSTTDTGTAEAMAAQTDLRLSRPVLLIVATTGSRRHVRARELRAWRWHPEKRRLEEDRIEDMLFPERYCPATEMLFAGD